MAHSVTVGSHRSTDMHRERTGWIGWAAFAGVMMILAGVMQAVYGLIAVVNDEWAVFGNRGSLYLDLTTWGWVHLAVGALVVLAGTGVLSGNAFARSIGVVMAGFSMLATFLFLPAYPIAALVVMTVDALVIYALVAHGRELRSQ